MKLPNVDKLIAGLDTILKGYAEIAPLAQKLGVPAVVANVATIGIAATGTIHNILERAADAKDALTTQDEGKLRAMLADLQAVNDKLAGVIAEDAKEGAEG